MIPEMRETLTYYYGVDLHEKYNRMVTDGWDSAQTHVSYRGVGRRKYQLSLDYFPSASDIQIISDHKNHIVPFLIFNF